MSGDVLIGFCILSHRDGEQLRNLVRALNEVYGFPPIVCHHDSSQSPFDPSGLPANVVLVSPAIRTGWGRLSVVRAGMLTISKMYSRFRPDWFVLLSASDYPIARSEKLRTILDNTDCDVFMDARPLLMQADGVASLVGASNPALDHFSSPANAAMKARFCLSPEVWIPILRLRPRPRLGRYTLRPPWTGRAARQSGLNFYYGDHWFMGNARAAAALTEDSSRRRFLLRHLEGRTQVDECFYQTMMMNSPGLKVCRDNLRFADWNGGGAHPLELTPEHLPELLGSDAPFARKFSPGSAALRRIDQEVLGLRPAAPSPSGEPTATSPGA